MATRGSLPPLRSDEDVHADRGQNILRSMVAIAVLSTLVVIGRFISRKVQKAKCNLSDYTIVLGLVGCWGIAMANIISVCYGLGQHVQIVAPLNHMAILLQLAFAAEILYAFTLPIIKISILLWYRRIFPGQGFVILTDLIGFLVIAWGIAVLVASILQCRPVSGFWDLTKPSQCIDSRKFFIGNSVPNISADVFILALPLVKIRHLQMSRKSKIMVSGLFLLGGFVCIVSGIRLYSLLEIDPEDMSWSYSGVAVWSVLEVNVAVISACLPTMRPLLEACGHALLSIASLAGLCRTWARAVGISEKTHLSKVPSQSPQTHKALDKSLPEYWIQSISSDLSPLEKNQVAWQEVERECGATAV